jgi:hypothetical protein
MLKMALELNVDSLDGIDESLHGLYVKGDNGYTLDVTGVEDVTGLKNALKAERDGNKSAKQKLAELEAEKEEAEKAILLEQGKYKDLSDKEKADRLIAQKELGDLKTKIANQKRDAMVKDLALGMTTDKDEIDIISRFALDYTAVEGDEVTFNKSEDEVKAELSRFVKSKASGGGDGGNNRGNGDDVPKTFKEKQKAHFNKQ